MNDPGLPAYLSCDPSQFICCKCSEDCENENPQQPSTIEESSAPAMPGRKQSQNDKKHPQRNHQSEACRRYSDRRTVLRTNSIQSDDVGGSVAVQHDGAAPRLFDANRHRLAAKPHRCAGRPDGGDMCRPDPGTFVFDPQPVAFEKPLCFSTGSPARDGDTHHSVWTHSEDVLARSPYPDEVDRRRIGSSRRGHEKRELELCGHAAMIPERFVIRDW